MVQVNPKDIDMWSTPALDEATSGALWAQYRDGHKDTITCAVALPGRTEDQYRWEIAHKKTVDKLMQRLSEEFT